MREVHIYRADGPDIEPVLIRIEREAPPISYADPDFVQKTGARFASEGAALAEAIWSSCSGGTTDAVIAALLARRASTFRVAFPQENRRA
jgi:hypothetical protein